jgi:Papain-like cysteine protease AvrRpt2
MPSNPLPVTISQQECSEWCWAAVGVAIGTFYKDGDWPSEQCKLVNQVLGISKDCCTECQCKTNPSDSCNQPQNLATVLAQHCRNDVNGITTMQFSQVRQEIDRGRPIAVSITLDDPAASGHAIIIFGYTEDGQVNVADPMHAGTAITMSFDDLVAGTGSELHGQWQMAFRTK